MNSKFRIFGSVSIVILFVIISCISVIGVNSDKNVTTYERAVDDNEEIITFITGSSCGQYIIKDGLVRDVEIFAGEGGTQLAISGWNRSPFERFSTGMQVEYIHAYRFIGVFFGTHYGAVRGIAIGNIEWSQ